VFQIRLSSVKSCAKGTFTAKMADFDVNLLQNYKIILIYAKKIVTLHAFNRMDESSSEKTNNIR